MQEHIAAGLEVILFLDAAPRDRLPDGVAVTRLDKGDVIDDEDSGLLDPREVLDGPLRAQLAVAPTIKGPGAAKGAIPEAAAGELDRSTGVEDADEVAPPVAGWASVLTHFGGASRDCSKRPV